MSPVDPPLLLGRGRSPPSLFRVFFGNPSEFFAFLQKPLPWDERGPSVCHNVCTRGLRSLFPRSATVCDRQALVLRVPPSFRPSPVWGTSISYVLLPPLLSKTLRTPQIRSCFAPSFEPLDCWTTFLSKPSIRLGEELFVIRFFSHLS